MDEQHAQTVADLLRKAGGNAGGMTDKVMEGIRTGNREVVGAAKDAQVRDASVIAAAQIAMHYYIAAYGTLASNANPLGMNHDAPALKRLADETKAQDQRFTDLAEQMANKRAA